MNTGKVVLGIVAGAAAGAVVALLLAPEKGSKTRTQISDKGENILNNLKSKFEDFICSIIPSMEDAKSKADDLLNKGKEKVQEAKNA